MKKNRTLFDDNSYAPLPDKKELQAKADTKEVTPLERLKNLEDKITNAIEKVRALKEEKTALERRIKDLEAKLDTKNHEIELLKSEKTAIKSQVEGLLNELEAIEVV